MPNTKYVYQVRIMIDVKRTDGDHLNDEENKMVLEMHEASEKVITEIMAKYGMNNTKSLGKKVRKY